MQIVNIITGLLAPLLVIGGVVTAIVFWARGHFRLRSFLTVAVSVFVLFLVGYVNDWPGRFCSCGATTAPSFP